MQLQAMLRELHSIEGQNKSGAAGVGVACPAKNYELVSRIASPKIPWKGQEDELDLEETLKGFCATSLSRIAQTCVLLPHRGETKPCCIRVSKVS